MLIGLWWNYTSVSPLDTNIDATLYDEHIIAIREEPVCIQWNSHVMRVMTRFDSRCVNLFKEFKTARTIAQHLSYSLKVNEFNWPWQSAFLSRMKCGRPGNFPVDVVTQSFPDVVKVVQKLMNTVFVDVPVHRARSPTMYGVTWNMWEFLNTVSLAIPGPYCDPMWFSPSDLCVCARAHLTSCSERHTTWDSDV